VIGRVAQEQAQSPLWNGVWDAYGALMGGVPKREQGLLLEERLIALIDSGRCHVCQPERS